jgi:hypothetical protein
MRRAMRHAQLIGAREPLMHRLVWALVREMGQAYPELVRAEKLIEETLRLEETRFRKTLARGLAILDEKSAGLKKGDMFDGDIAFTLYDTYGFPLDLTQDALKSRGISVDQASFTDAMDRQREKARRGPLLADGGQTAHSNKQHPTPGRWLRQPGKPDRADRPVIPPRERRLDDLCQFQPAGLRAGKQRRCRLARVQCDEGSGCRRHHERVLAGRVEGFPQGWHRCLHVGHAQAMRQRDRVGRLAAQVGLRRCECLDP